MSKYDVVIKNVEAIKVRFRPRCGADPARTGSAVGRVGRLSGDAPRPTERGLLHALP